MVSRSREPLFSISSDGFPKGSRSARMSLQFCTSVTRWLTGMAESGSVKSVSWGQRGCRRAIVLPGAVGTLGGDWGRPNHLSSENGSVLSRLAPRNHWSSAEAGYKVCREE